MRELQHITLREGADLAGFRDAVRLLIAQGAGPGDVAWSIGAETDMFGGNAPVAGHAPVALPRAAGELIELVVCHRDPERYALLYTLVWRILHGERALLEVASDPLVHRLQRMEKTIRRELHKMHAFVRFRRAGDAAGDDERFVAWFEPEHYILEAVADFFVERFRGLSWTILTPLGSLSWDREVLRIGPAGQRSDAPESDRFEDGWRGYYESTFNPARVNPQAMRAEMPQRYWQNLPEARSIDSLVRTAPERTRRMIEREATETRHRNPDKAVAAMSKQEPATLKALNRIIAASEPLVPGATRAVLGQGPIGAAIAFVGEQPGDQEDLQGLPFVGPAGELLTRAMEEAGIPRDRVYVTNAVKHFKFERRGKRRIHKSPTAGEVKHYRWWLMKELSFVRPRLVVTLGATAALAMQGKAVAVTRSRGPAMFGEQPGFITVHPSYLLRLPDAEARQQAYAQFVKDLTRVREMALAAETA